MNATVNLPPAARRAHQRANAASRREPVPAVGVDGVRISTLGFAATVERIGEWLDTPGPRRVATANLDFLRIASEDTEFRAALASSDLVTADGWPVVRLARQRGGRIDERVAGSDLVPALAAECARRGRSVYLLGGFPGTAAEAAAKLVEANPGLRIAGAAWPRVDLNDDAACAALAAEIRETEADLLLVGLGAPKQDVFLARWIGETGCRVGLGVGGTFDFVAGRIRRAPRIAQTLRLEWAWRLAKEPRRLLGRYAADARYLVRAEVRRVLGRGDDRG